MRHFLIPLLLTFSLTACSKDKPKKQPTDTEMSALLIEGANDNYHKRLNAAIKKFTRCVKYFSKKPKDKVMHNNITYGHGHAISRFGRALSYAMKGEKKKAVDDLWWIHKNGYRDYFLSVGFHIWRAKEFKELTTEEKFRLMSINWYIAYKKMQQK